MNKLNLGIMSKKNKIIFSCLIIFLLIFSVVGITSYLSDADSIDNIFTIGGNRVELVEEFNPPDKLEPGISFQKDVKVKNSGPNACYVRVKAVFNNSDVGQYCEVDWNTKDWTYNAEDGYWYYKEPISRWEKTTSLFTTVKLADDIPSYAIDDFDMIIYGESYQSESFDAYEDAWGNYEKNKDDSLGPAVNIAGLTATTQENFGYTNSANYEVTVNVSDSNSGVASVVVNGVDASMNSDEAWKATVTLETGKVTEISVTATDKAGNTTTKTGYVYADVNDPSLEVPVEFEGTTSETPIEATEASYKISGTASDTESGLKSVTVNGVEVVVNEDGTWTHTVSLTADQVTKISVVATDKVDNAITKTGYVSYTEVVSYTVTNNLTNATSDNVAESAEENSKYVAVLTADSGYEIDVDSLVVTMGTVDITDVAYNNGTITIDSVTDNIAITATAYKVYTVTNNLKYVTSSNAATVIKENEIYTATLTPNEGYDLANFNVIVMMGDEDITSTAYANGTIIIDTVTENITIIASEDK